MCSSVITLAIENGDADLVRELLRHTNCDTKLVSVDTHGFASYDALSWAVPLHQYEICRLLCVKGTEVTSNTLSYAFTRYDGLKPGALTSIDRPGPCWDVVQQSYAERFEAFGFDGAGGYGDTEAAPEVLV